MAVNFQEKGKELRELLPEGVFKIGFFFFFFFHFIVIIKLDLTGRKKSSEGCQSEFIAQLDCRICFLLTIRSSEYIVKVYLIDMARV